MPLSRSIRFVRCAALASRRGRMLAAAALADPLPAPSTWSSCRTITVVGSGHERATGPIARPPHRAVESYGGRAPRQRARKPRRRPRR